MSITTYSELQAAVGNWLNRSDLTSNIPDFIMLAENVIYRRLRIRAMESNFTLTIANGVAALPSDYLELKHAYVDGSPMVQLEKKSSAWIYENYPQRSSDSKPLYIAEDTSNFIFGPFPDSNYTVKGTYYQRLPALSNTNTTNWFITNAPGLLLFGALKEAEPFLKNDDRVALWESKFNGILDSLDMQERRTRYSGSALSGTASNR
jgi:hypothetical protein